MIVARTDARSVEGFDAAVHRARDYMEAGADMIFPEALESADEFARFARAVNAPLLANMTEFGRSPLLSFDELAGDGIQGRDLSPDGIASGDANRRRGSDDAARPGHAAEPARPHAISGRALRLAGLSRTGKNAIEATSRLDPGEIRLSRRSIVHQSGLDLPRSAGAGLNGLDGGARAAASRS